jgi:hypothetical protein
MALTEETENDKIEVVSMGAWKVVQVRKATIIKKDGVEVTRTFHRHVVSPTDDITNEDADVQAICNATFTEDMRTAYTNAQA